MQCKLTCDYVIVEKDRNLALVYATLDKIQNVMNSVN